ncbi:acylphosphatase [Candidatus Omnitrophota bacterium]
MAYKRIHVFYSGRVQGVGFRYTARNIASHLGLNGWTRNLMDSRVEVICEGEENKLKEFLANVKNGLLGDYITSADVRWEKPTREFSSFDIKF